MNELNRIVRRAAVVASTLLASTALLSLTASTAMADTFPEPGHERVWSLDGGGQAAVGSVQEQITRVQPLTTAGTTREFFASVKAFGQLALPQGVSADGVLSTGFQVGCMAGYGGTSFGLSVTPSINGNGAITGGFQGGPGGNGTLAVTPGISVTPSINVTTTAGVVTDVPLGKWQLKTQLGVIHVQEAHINVDGCIGPVSARSYTKFEVATLVGMSTDAVYGQVFPL